MAEFSEVALLCIAGYLHDLGKAVKFRNTEFRRQFPQCVDKHGKNPPHAVVSDWLLGGAWPDYRKRSGDLRVLIGFHHPDAEQARDRCGLPGPPADPAVQKMLASVRWGDGMARSASAPEILKKGGANQAGRFRIAVEPSFRGMLSPFWLAWVVEAARRRRGGSPWDGGVPLFREVFPGAPVGFPSQDEMRRKEEAAVDGLLSVLKGFSLGELCSAGSFDTEAWSRFRNCVRECLQEFYEEHAIEAGTGMLNLGKAQDVSLWLHSSLTAVLAVCRYLSPAGGVSLGCLAFPRAHEILDVPSDGALRQIKGRLLLLEQKVSGDLDRIRRDLMLPPDAVLLRWSAGAFFLLPRGLEERVFAAFDDLFQDPGPSWSWPRVAVVPVQEEALSGAAPRLGLDSAIADAWCGAWGCEGGRGVVPVPAPSLAGTGSCRVCGVPGPEWCAVCREADALGREEGDAVADTGGAVDAPYAAGLVRLGLVGRMLDGVLRGCLDPWGLLLSPERLVAVLGRTKALLDAWTGVAGGQGRRVVLCRRPDEVLVFLPAGRLLEACAEFEEELRRRTWVRSENLGLGMRFVLADARYPVRDAFRAALSAGSRLRPGLEVGGVPVPGSVRGLALKVRDELGEEACWDLAHVAAMLPRGTPGALRALAGLARRRRGPLQAAVGLLEAFVRENGWEVGVWPREGAVAALRAAAAGRARPA